MPVFLPHPRIRTVRPAGFEPATPCTLSRCATKLRHGLSPPPARRGSLTQFPVPFQRHVDRAPIRTLLHILLVIPASMCQGCKQGSSFSC